MRRRTHGNFLSSPEVEPPELVTTLLLVHDGPFPLVPPTERAIGVLLRVVVLQCPPSIIRLCHRICPRNWLRAFALLGAVASRIALTLSGSTAIPSCLQCGRVGGHLLLRRRTLPDSGSVGIPDIFPSITGGDLGARSAGYVLQNHLKRPA